MARPITSSIGAFASSVTVLFVDATTLPVSFGFGVFVLGSIAFFFFWKNRLHKRNLHLLYEKERELEIEVAELRKILPVEWSPSPDTTGNEAESLNDLLRRTYLLMEKEKLYLKWLKLNKL